MYEIVVTTRENLMPSPPGSRRRTIEVVRQTPTLLVLRYYPLDAWLVLGLILGFFIILPIWLGNDTLWKELLKGNIDWFTIIMFLGYLPYGILSDIQTGIFNVEEDEFIIRRQNLLRTHEIRCASNHILKIELPSTECFGNNRLTIVCVDGRKQHLVIDSAEVIKVVRNFLLEHRHLFQLVTVTYSRDYF